MNEILKQYLQHGIDKLFFTLISIKNWVFLSVFTVSSWLTYLEKIDGTNFAIIVGILVPTIVAGREISKKNIVDIIKDKIEG